MQHTSADPAAVSTRTRQHSTGCPWWTLSILAGYGLALRRHMQLRTIRARQALSRHRTAYGGTGGAELTRIPTWTLDTQYSAATQFGHTSYWIDIGHAAVQTGAHICNAGTVAYSNQ